MSEARTLLLLDSIAAIEPAAVGAVIVSGSHGGASAARYALSIPRPPHAVFFNDAGVGKDRAGVIALDMLQGIDAACAVYGHQSARIGDAADGLEHGVITEVNRAAARLGLRAGMRVAEAVRSLGARSGRSA
ncbi:MAG: hypothetical protein JSW68_14120 [Burkholderiales bacterium]|nr:MAG: hypothetical protein JSW68_14120 [Burkholderiales bacterium]